MAFPNSFDAKTTRRLAVGLMTSSGALMFSALNLVGAGVSAGDRAFAAAASGAVWPLAVSGAFGLLAFICAEIADHPSTPGVGHPHSKPNYLQTAFALVGGAGLYFLAFGTLRLIGAADVACLDCG